MIAKFRQCDQPRKQMVKPIPQCPLPLVAPLRQLARWVAVACVWWCAQAPDQARAAAGDLEGGIRFGGHEARPDRLSARFQPDLARPDKELRGKLAALGVTVLRRTEGVPGLVTLLLNPPARGDDAADQLAGRIKRLLATGWFRYVEPDWIVRALATPSDSAFADGTLWGLRNNGQAGGTAGADIKAVAAWDITTGSAAVTVAVIDTGIRYTHQDLAANMWVNPGEIPANGVDDDGNGYIDDVHGINSITGSGNPMDDNNHGTHCAGTIGAVANGGGPHVGVAWNVRLMGLKFLSSSGSGATSDAIECVNYGVARGVKILSNSWGGGGYSQGLYDSIVAARNAGVLFVAAAGNESNNNDQTANYPSNYDGANVVAVAALDRNDQLANFSNYGRATVDLGAPGVAIYSTTAASDTSYSSFNGTSMAAPHVAGAAVLLAAAHPGGGFIEWKQRLMAAARPVSSLAGKAVTGGTLDAHGALAVSADGILEIRATASTSPLPAGGSVQTFITVTDLAPVTGATVDARFGSQSYVRHYDNGISPDATAGDGVYSATMSVPSGAGNVALHVEASAPGKTPGSADITFAISVPPPNDRFANRALVAAGSTQSTGTNVTASSETGEPRNPSVAGGKSVWWSWTAASSTTVTISTAGSSFDTTLAIYTGGTLAGLSLVGANDDSGGLQSAVTFNATAGTAYAIQVDGYSGATGSITLNHPVTGAAPGAPVIVTNPFHTSVLVGQPFALQVVAQGDAPLSFQWYRNGSLVSGATAASYAKSAAALGDEGDYQVLVSNTKGSALSANAYLSVEQTAIIPENDTFASATVITGASGRIRASNRLATGETGEPNHASAAAPLASVWWQWTATQNGTLALDTLGSSFDTVLAAYTGSTVAALTPITSNNDADGTPQSRVSFPVISGQVYRIAIDGAGAAEGSIVFNYLFDPGAVTQPNDNFANRTHLGSGSVSVPGSNIRATGETGEPNHASRSTPLASVWWSWTAVSPGTVVIDTNGSDFDTTLAVYSGTAVAALSLLASNDDGGNGVNSRVSLLVQTGQVLQIAVDGYGSEEGSVVLRVSFTPGAVAPPANDNFAAGFLIAPGIDQATGSNVNATGEPGEPSHHTSAVQPFNSVWWRWAAPISGTLTVTTAGSINTAEDDMDTVLAVYRGTAVNALTYVASNDDEDLDNDIYTSRVSFAVTAGLIYQIAVDGYDDEVGDIVLTLSLAGSGPAPTLAQALDNPTLAWTTGGNASWSGVLLPSHDGMDSARSGGVGNDGASWLATSVTGPGTLNFWWKVESEESFDFLTLSVGGIEVEAISGWTDWQAVAVPIPAGTHALRWSYAKDDSFSDGRDCGWVDEVSFVPTGFAGWIGGFPSIPSHLRGPLDDADGDGLPNQIEYYQNTSPADGRSRGGISVPVVNAPGQFTATFRRNKDAPDATGLVQWTPDLSNWALSGQAIGGTAVTMVQAVNTSPADHDLVTITGTVTGNQPQGVYLRLRVVQN